MRGGPLGVATAGKERADSISGVPAGHAGAQLGDRSRAHETEDGRGARWRRIEPAALQQVGAIDGGGRDVDQYLTGRGTRVRRVAEMFSASGIPCRPLADLRYGRWEKLVWNIPFNGLSAVLDQTTDRLIDTPAGEALVRDLMEEVIAAARGVDRGTMTLAEAQASPGVWRGATLLGAPLLAPVPGLAVRPLASVSAFRDAILAR